MNGFEEYKIRSRGNVPFNYLFDRIVSILVKSEYHKIGYPKKALIIRNDHVGDMILSTNVFSEFKNAFPKCKITVMTSHHNRSLIEKDKHVDDIIPLGLFWRRGLKGFQEYLKVLKRIKKENFDVGITLRNSKLNSLFLLYIPKIKTRVGYYNINGGKPFLTHPILYSKIVHGLKEDMELLEKAFNIKIKKVMPELSYDREDKKKTESFLKENGISKYIMVVPGTTVENKRWPIPKVAEFIRRFHEKYPSYKILISGPERDREIIDFLCKGNESFCVQEIGKLNLREFGIALKKAKEIIANNGAGTDIGWVAGGNLVYLAGPVSLKIDLPLKKTKILRHEIRPDYGDVSLITVEEVMKAVDEFITTDKNRK